jgi:hypothetical protein
MGAATELVEAVTEIAEIYQPLNGASSRGDPIMYAVGVPCEGIKLVARPPHGVSVGDRNISTRQ